MKRFTVEINDTVSAALVLAGAMSGKTVEEILTGLVMKSFNAATKGAEEQAEAPMEKPRKGRSGRRRRAYNAVPRDVVSRIETYMLENSDEPAPSVARRFGLSASVIRHIARGEHPQQRRAANGAA